MKHIVTQEDIDNNKFDKEVKVGDEIEISEEEKSEEVTE